MRIAWNFLSRISLFPSLILLLDQSIPDCVINTKYFSQDLKCINASASPGCNYYSIGNTFVFHGYPSQLNKIYADESETNTEQGLSQENIGSGESINSNCGQNLIDSSALTDCGGLPPETPSDSGILKIVKIVSCPQGFEEICPIPEEFRMFFTFDAEEGKFFILVPGSSSGVTLVIPASILPTEYTVDEPEEPPVPAGLALESEKSSCDGTLQPGESIVCVVRNVYTAIS